MNTLDKFFEESKLFSDFAERYFGYLHERLNLVDKKELNNLIEVLLTGRKNGATIFLMGNGGSAAIATHFANDLCKFTKRKAKNFKALSLTDNILWFTALANDEGYESVFSSQLDNFIKEGDIVIGISSSGNSSNIVKALELANDRGAISIAIVGFNGGKIKEVAAYSIHVPTCVGEYGPTEDIHMALCHLIAIYIAFSQRSKSSMEKAEWKLSL